MYEEGNKKLSFNWVSLALKLLIVAVFVFILCWLFTRNATSKDSKTVEKNTEYINNITAMKEAAFEYFTESHLPSSVGGTEKLTLEQMINQKLLIDFTDDGDKCDTKDSYVQTTKTADGDYALKVSLNCGKNKDFIVTTIENKKCVINCDNNNNSNANNSSTNTSTTDNAKKPTSNNSSSTSTKTNTIVKTTVKVTVSYDYGNNSNNNNNSNNQDKKTRYYKYVKYGDWYYGYSNAPDTENKEFSNSSYKFCKDTTQTIYSTSYTSSTKEHSYTYTLKFTNIDAYDIAEGSISVINSSKKYFSDSLTDYKSYTNSNYNNKPIEMVGNNKNYNSAIYNVTTFKNSSLKKSNFTFDVSSVYQSGRNFYVDVTIKVKNTNGVSAYYDNNLRYSLYYVPIKFDISYSKNKDCLISSNYNYYANTLGYSVLDEYSDPYWMHRSKEYIWSTESSLKGWTYTGIYEDRV